MRTRIMQDDPRESGPATPDSASLARSAPPHSNNFAARMGRWSAGHRKIAIFGWLAFVIVAFMLQSAVPMKVIDRNDAAVGEAATANKILGAGFDIKKTGLGEFVLVQSKTKTVND